MKLTILASGVATAVMLIAGPAAAQSVTPIYYGGEEQKAISVDDVVKDDSSQKDDCLQKDDCCDLGKDCGKDCVDMCCAPMCAGDPWELMPRTCRGYKVGGHFQLGYHTEGENGDGTGLFNNYPNRVQMQQAWFYAEKAINNGGCGFDWGFRFDMLYGTDAPNTQAFGSPDDQWDNPWDNGEAYGWAIPQLYAELAYNNLSAKVGHFYTIAGYEVVPATGNFFYSHAFTMNMAEPFTHTGILAEYALGDRITLYGGWTQGWDTGFEQWGGNTFLGGFGIDVTEDVSFTYTTTLGEPGFGDSDPNSYTHSIVLDSQLTDRLNWVIMGDYVDSSGLFSGYPPFADKRWSVVNYLFYDITDCIAAGVRYEYFETDIPLPVDAPHVNSYTAGLNIRPHANVVIRPEVRYDDYDEFLSGMVDDTTTFGIDAIFTY